MMAFTYTDHTKIQNMAKEINQLDGACAAWEDLDSMSSN